MRPVRATKRALSGNLTGSSSERARVRSVCAKTYGNACVEMCEMAGVGYKYTTAMRFGLARDYGPLRLMGDAMQKRREDVRVCVAADTERKSQNHRETIPAGEIGGTSTAVQRDMVFSACTRGQSAGSGGGCPAWFMLPRLERAQRPSESRWPWALSLSGLLLRLLQRPRLLARGFLALLVGSP